MMEQATQLQPYNSVLSGRHGSFIYNRFDTYVGRSMEHYGEYCEHEVELFSQLCEASDKVVEVGANIGAHTVALSSIVGTDGRVYAFEPQRIVFQTLCGNVALNSLSNVECFQMALSNEDGFVYLPDFMYNVESNFGGFDVNSLKEDCGANKVRLAKLDTILELDHLKLIKIDVEGMEVPVIQGASGVIQKHRPFIYVENDRVEHSKELIELIFSFGYRIFWHITPLYNPDNHFKNSNNIFPTLVSCNMLCIHSSQHINSIDLGEVLKSDVEMHPFYRKA